MTDVYDSVTSASLRLARRWWPWLLALVVAISVAGYLASGESVAVRGTTAVTVNDGRGSELDTKIDLTVSAGAVQTRYDDTHGGNDAKVSNAPGRTGDVVNLTISAADEARARQGLDDWVALLRTEAIQPVQDDAATAVADAEAAHAATQELVDSLTAKVDAAGDGPAVTAAIVALAQAQSDLSAQAAALRDAQAAQRDAAALELQVNSVDWVSTSSSSLDSFAGVLAGLVMAGLLCVAIVVFDGRVRRSLHLVRAAPSVPVAGVLPRDDDAEAARVAAVLAAWAAGSSQVLVLDPGGGAAEDEVVRLLRAAAPDLRIDAAGGAVPPPPTAGDPPAVLVVARFGASKEDVVNVACAALTGAGFHRVATVLWGVPRRDLTWASVQPVQE